MFLTGNAKRFYRRDIEDKVTSLQEAVDPMDKEYNSFSRQSRVGNYLKSLRIEDIARENNISNFAALEKLTDQIPHLIRQGPAHSRSEQHKIDYLRSAVIVHSWGKDPLSRAAATTMSFNELITQLASAI